MIVIDASMALAWHFPDERSPRARSIDALCDTASVVVPRHWFAEVANGLLFGARRPGVTAAEQARFLRRIDLIDLQIDAIEPDRVFNHILPLARAHGLTIYDTFYLELADRLGLPLASLDKELNTAARNIGILLVEEDA